MKKKLLIIFDILFRNGQYLKATKDLFVKDNLYIKEKVVHPLNLIGRTIVTKPESENIPEEIIFKQALSEILKYPDLLSYVETSKFDVHDQDLFLNDTRKVAYEVKLTIIPKKQIPNDNDIMQACIDQVKDSGFDVGYTHHEFVEKFK